MARDYEFAERIGTKEAWQYFLKAHKSGYYTDLARAALEKITAAEKRQTLATEAEQKAAAAGAKRQAVLQAASRKAAEEVATQRGAEEARLLRAAEQARLKAEAEAKKLAEEQAKLQAKLAAEAQPAQAPIVVANAPGAAAATRNVAPAIDPGDLARLLQIHLKRVGCDPGAVDGKWTEQSGRALQQFNKRAHTALDVKVASLAALETVKQHKARVCPLECGKGFKAEGDRCVATACRRGYVRNKGGDCEREIRKTQARPAAHEESGGGQIYCGQGGCRPVPKGCHIVRKQGHSFSMDQFVICN